MRTAPRAAQVKTLTFAINPSQLRVLRQRGFTLIELLVVLAIAGLLIAVVPVAYTKSRESAQYRSTVRTLVADLHLGRQSAVASGQTVVLSLDLAQRKYGLAGHRTHDLPDFLQIRATVGSEQLQQNRKASIAFLPDGGSTGGSFDVIRPNGDGTRLRVDWLSGQVTQERLEP